MERERFRELFRLFLLDDLLDFLGELGRLSLSDPLDRSLDLRELLPDDRDDFLVRDDLLAFDCSFLLLEIDSTDSDLRRLNVSHSFL